MFYISYGCSFINGPAAFRVPWALQMIPAILLFFGMLFLPESPRWLASKDRWEECERVLILVHGKGDPNNPWVHREFQEIKEWVQLEREAKNVSYLELIRPRMINRTHIGLFTQIWSQLTGMNVMSRSIIHKCWTVLTEYSVLYHICLCHGRPFWQHSARLVIHSICHQCCHDYPSPALC